MKNKNNLFLCFKKYLIGFTYVFFVFLLIASGNQQERIVTTNINSVKSVKSSKLVNYHTSATQKYYEVFNTTDIKNYGSKYKLKFTGTLTGYGPDCPGCGGHVACYPNQDVRNGNIYYDDKEYGRIRIVAADRSIPCGSIIKISNYKFSNGDFYGIVLDRGSSIVGLTMDLLYTSENDTVDIGRTYNISFKIERWRY